MIGIVVALDSEAKGFISILKNKTETQKACKKLVLGEVSGEKIALIVSGIGKVNAAFSSQILIDLFSPKYILNFGTAGGLKKEISVADIYAINQCAQYDFDLSELDNVKRGYIQDYDTVFFDVASSGIPFLNKGILCSGDRFSDSIIDYNNIVEMGANVKDMEGAAIAEVCAANKIPLYVIKGITDVYGNNSTAEQFKNNLDSVCKKFPETVKKVIEYIK